MIISMQRLDQTAVRALRTLLDGQPTTAAKVEFAWRIAAGSNLARAASVSWTPAGTLHVRARSDAWRHEIARARPIIDARIADLLGPDVVRRITIDTPESAAARGPRRARG
jgi:hypothetical protein